MIQGRHCLVTGRVQGVYFRAWTRDVATRLGLTGWVRNLPDGRVELAAWGEPQRLDELEKFLHQGPPLSRVDAVQAEPIQEEADAKDFSIRY